LSSKVDNDIALRLIKSMNISSAKYFRLRKSTWMSQEKRKTSSPNDNPEGLPRVGPHNGSSKKVASSRGDNIAMTLPSELSKSPPRVTTKSVECSSTSTPRRRLRFEDPIANASSLESLLPLSMAAYHMTSNV